MNPSTWNPGTMLLANMMINPFMMKEKIPKVNTVMGKASNDSSGLINVFKTPRTIATTIVVVKLSICTPVCNK